MFDSSAICCQKYAVFESNTFKSAVLENATASSRGFFLIWSSSKMLTISGRFQLAITLRARCSCKDRSIDFLSLLIPSNSTVNSSGSVIKQRQLSVQCIQMISVSNSSKCYLSFYFVALTEYIHTDHHQDSCLQCSKTHKSRLTSLRLQINSYHPSLPCDGCNGLEWIPR